MLKQQENTMNIFKEIKDGVNEMDPVQEQLTPREKAGAIFGVVLVMGFMLLSFTQGFAWATVFFMTLIVLCINVALTFLVVKEVYYIIKNIRYNMQGMW